jgi:hypothetical protein
MGAKDFSSKPKIHSPPQKIQYVNHERKMITKKWIMMVFTIGQETKEMTWDKWHKNIAINQHN